MWDTQHREKSQSDAVVDAYDFLGIKTNVRPSRAEPSRAAPDAPGLRRRPRPRHRQRARTLPWATVHVRPWTDQFHGERSPAHVRTNARVHAVARRCTNMHAHAHPTRASGRAHPPRTDETATQLSVGG
jgi:hypothetical protein